MSRINFNFIKKDMNSQLPILLDPLSDRYRVCPNCGKPHMVANRGRDFCSDWCADAYYNKNRRLIKQAELSRGGYVTQQRPQVIETVKPQSTYTVLDVNSRKQKNKEFLNRLGVDKVTGTKYNLSDLLAHEFDLTIFDEKQKLYNTPTDISCFCLVFGGYSMYLVEKDLVLIAKTGIN